MERLEQILDSLSNLVWGWPLLVLLVGTHLYLTVRLRVIQRYLGTAIRLSFSRTAEGEGDVSHFGALTTALAATIGTGNIVGVATAVAAGGPGAVLWMWLTGIFGIATKYGEAVLAIKSLLYEQGYRIDGAKRRLRELSGEEPSAQLKGVVEAVRQVLADLEKIVDDDERS